MIFYKTPSKSIEQETTTYVVQVDSRGRNHHVSDLECYKEQTCGTKFFQRSIAENTHEFTCAKSLVAILCGLDLKLYFKEKKFPGGDDDDSSQPSDEEEDNNSNNDEKHDIRTKHSHDSSYYKRHHCLEHELMKDHNDHGYKINAIATALTFNPYTGYYGHIVKSEAYVVLDDGKTELSKRQVWGLTEFIREVKSEYHFLAGGCNDDKCDGHYSDEAKMLLMEKAREYREGHWVPHSIYEPRHHHIHQHQHHQPHNNNNNKESAANNPYPFHHHPGHNVQDERIDHRGHKKVEQQKQKQKQYERFDSGLSDQATCHHGHTHIHHNGHHECCHDHIHSYPKKTTDQYQHHIVTPSKDGDDDDDDSDDIVHQRTHSTKKVTTGGGGGFGRIIMNLSDDLCHSSFD